MIVKLEWAKTFPDIIIWVSSSRCRELIVVFPDHTHLLFITKTGPTTNNELILTVKPCLRTQQAQWGGG